MFLGMGLFVRDRCDLEEKNASPNKGDGKCGHLILVALNGCVNLESE
jgi:hypothetical protein